MCEARDDALNIGRVEDHEMATVRQLFRDYAAWLQVDLCLEGFEAELAALPGPHAPPAGGIWLARSEKEGAVGVVAGRPLSAAVCEVRRLWVGPAQRGRGTARLLVNAAVRASAAQGYATMSLETLPFMAAAQKLYQDLGFADAPCPDPQRGKSVRYMELDLRAGGQGKVAP